MNFTNKTVWVTGAGSGIGKIVAQQFQATGARVIGLDKQFTKDPHSYRKIYVDISQPQQVAEVCQSLLKEEHPLDILVNSAGVLRLGSIAQLSLEDWHHCINVNASACFYLLQQLMPHFKRQASGAIISIASNAAHTPRLGMAAYGASKAALTSLTFNAGLELAPFGIRCNVVSPGTTDTPMLAKMLTDQQAIEQTIQGIPQDFKLGIPLGKIAQPDDIANAVLFLASDLAGHITLQDITIDGGATLAA